MIVVLDSNVGISALQFGGSPQLALERAITVDELAISDFIEHEIIRVLNRKFRHPESSARAILQEYAGVQQSGNSRQHSRDSIGRLPRFRR